MNYFSKEKYLSQRSVNNLQTLSIIGGMLLLFASMGWLFAGFLGVLMMVGAVCFSLYLLSKMRPNFMLRHFHAREITPYERSHLNSIFQELCRRADLERLPKLYRIPSEHMLAFAVGPTQANASVAISDAILRSCNQREVAGILAHEISHIKNGDTLVMGLADAFTRMTSVMSNVGLVLIFLSIPGLLVAEEWIPWTLILILLVAPVFSSLLQLALSRTREFNADLDAAALTGDPRALASALQKVEYGQMNFWQRIFLPYRRKAQPTLLSTHPPTEERIERLLALEEKPAVYSKALPIRRMRPMQLRRAQPVRVVRPAYRMNTLFERIL